MRHSRSPERSAAQCLSKATAEPSDEATENNMACVVVAEAREERASVVMSQYVGGQGGSDETGMPSEHKYYLTQSQKKTKKYTPNVSSVSTSML